MDHQDNADAKATSKDEVGISSSPDSLNDRPDISGVGISTVDDQPKDAGITAEEQRAEADAKAKDAAEAAKDGEAGKDTGKKGQEGRYDQDPDWQRMKQERDDAVLKVAKLEGMIAGAGKPPADGELSGTIPVIGTEPLIPYKDITKMSKEELLEWFEDDPIGYEANRFAQFVHEGEILRAQREESVKRTNTIKQTFDNYEKDNPDFKEAWESGKIKQFMDAHPGHNAISAHMMMSKSANRQSEVEKIQAQIDQAVNAAVEKERKNFAAKRNADTIGDGSGGVKTGAGANELADTKSQGGLISAISARLAKSRQAA